MIVLGANYVVDNGLRFSRGLVLLNGTVVSMYEKIFPSYAVREIEIIDPGRQITILELNQFRLTCLICVDIFYPELIRALKIMYDINIVLNPANISIDRVNLWKCICLGRAFENHVYVITANLVNTTYPDGRLVKGHSFACSPNGELLIELPEKEHVEVVKVRIEDVKYAEERRRFTHFVKKLINYEDFLKHFKINVKKL